MANFRYGKMDKKASRHLSKLASALIKEKKLMMLSNLLVKTAFGLCVINKKNKVSFRTTGHNKLYNISVVLSGRIKKRR